MARAKTENSLDQSLLKPDESAQGAPRIAAFSEIGTTGLKIVQKQVLEDSRREWQMPTRIKTINSMCDDGYLSAAIDFFIYTLGQVEWRVESPVGANAQQKERAKAVQTMMDDMDHSWFSFVVSLLSSVKYGFSIHEKVYKRRVKGNSKFDDGLVGWKKFPSRAQSTLYGWEFSDDGRDLTAFLQTLDNIQYSERYLNLAPDGQPIRIPREKFMLFRTSPQNDNPEGRAALRAAYVAWKYKKFVEEEEAKGLGRDLGGLLNIKIPAAYMSPNADADKQAVFKEYQRAARNVSVGEQSCIITPSDLDQETKGKLFEVDLLTSQGGKSYDTNQIISRYTSQMLVALAADLLQLGTDATGSFALAGAKQDVVEMALTFRLKEIRDVLNSELITQTYKMNGWDDQVLPTFEFGEISKTDLESLGKFLQRVGAVSMIERDRGVLNVSRKALGLQPFSEEDPVHEEELPSFTSGAGKGMTSGMPSGTGDATGSAGNASDTNSDNAS